MESFCLTSLSEFFWVISKGYFNPDQGVSNLKNKIKQKQTKKPPNLKIPPVASASESCIHQVCFPIPFSIISCH